MAEQEHSRVSIVSLGSRHQFAVAIALISAIPLLTILYAVLSRLHGASSLSVYGETAIAASLICFILLGYIMLRRYPVNITRFRKYLEQMVKGEFPEAISLISSEDDIRAVEKSLNVLLSRLKKKISVVQGERDRLEKQLYQAQKLETIGSLAAGISHEINTPIQFVRDNTRFLGDSVKRILQLTTDYRQALPGSEAEDNGPDLDSLGKEMVKVVAESEDGLARIAEIMRAMKSYLHPGNGEEKTMADINAIIEETVTLSRNQWKHIAVIRKMLDPELPPVSCLEGEIRQAFMNLVINAAYATAKARHVNGKEKGLISITSCRVDDTAAVRISDTGTGISPEIGDRVFERFFTTKEPGKGTGLGLALAYSSIVEKHGGTLTFKSGEGKGTTFTVVLPLTLSR